MNRKSPLRKLIRVEDTKIILRTFAMDLTIREKDHADRIARRLWPGLVPLPIVTCHKAKYKI